MQDADEPRNLAAAAACGSSEPQKQGASIGLGVCVFIFCPHARPATVPSSLFLLAHSLMACGAQVLELPRCALSESPALHWTSRSPAQGSRAVCAAVQSQPGTTYCTEAVLSVTAIRITGLLNHRLCPPQQCVCGWGCGCVCGCCSVLWTPVTAPDCRQSRRAC